MTVAVLLDIDGTLLTALGEGRKAYFEALETVFPGRSFELLDMAGRTDRGIWNQLVPDAAPSHWSSFLESYHAALDRRLGDAPPRVLPGVVELCRKLSEDPRFEPGIVTGNLAAGSRIKIRRGCLHPWLDGVPGAYGDEVDDKSGQAREVLAAWKSARPRAVVVGDTTADFECARGAGAAFLAVGTGGGTREELAEADAWFDDLSATDSVLDALWRIAR